MAINPVPFNTDNDGSGGATSSTLTFPVTATLGNLLIAGLSTDSISGVISTPSGWTLANKHEGFDVSNAVFWKESDGTETGVIISWVNNRNFRTYLGEISSTDLDLSSAPELAEDESNVTTVVTSQSTGTTASISTSESLGIAIHAADQAFNVDAGRALTNSYIERTFLVSGNNRAMFSIATKAISGTGTQECTYSTTDVGDQMYGQILVFKGSAGAPAGIPIFRRRIEGH